jgi:bifunctional pyridoxal-dependent enzyme with beta-cystathionase and maltose regulon repressor activities
MEASLPEPTPRFDDRRPSVPAVLRKVTLTEGVTVKELAEKLEIKHKDVIKAPEAAHCDLTSLRLALSAAEAAYREGGAWHDELLRYLRANRDAIEAFVAAELPRVRMTHVEATYLAWLDVRELGLEDPAAACRSAGVALSAGAAFGDPAHLRLNFGCRRETLDGALRRLATVLR